MNRCKVLIVVMLLCLLPGCLGRSSPQVTYFSLLTMEQMGDTHTLTSLQDISLGVGPVTITDSLKRAQIVTRSQSNQYEFDEFNRWAGVMEWDISAVLGDNLGQLLGVDKIADFPWMSYFKPTYRVIVDIQRLDGELDGEAVLSARWVVADAEGKELLAARKVVYRRPLESASYAALVKAESQLVAELSKEIAGEIVAIRE